MHGTSVHKDPALWNEADNKWWEPSCCIVGPAGNGSLDHADSLMLGKTAVDGQHPGREQLSSRTLSWYKPYWCPALPLSPDIKSKESDRDFVCFWRPETGVLEINVFQQVLIEIRSESQYHSPIYALDEETKSFPFMILGAYLTASSAKHEHFLDRVSIIGSCFISLHYSWSTKAHLTI